MKIVVATRVLVRNRVATIILRLCFDQIAL